MLCKDPPETTTAAIATALLSMDTDTVEVSSLAAVLAARTTTAASAAADAMQLHHCYYMCCSVDCGMPSLEPIKCQMDGCNTLVHHVCQITFEERIGHESNSITTLCCAHNEAYCQYMKEKDNLSLSDRRLPYEHEMQAQESPPDTSTGMQTRVVLKITVQRGMLLQGSLPDINTVMPIGVPTVLLDSNILDEGEIIFGDSDEGYIDELMQEAYSSVAASASASMNDHTNTYNDQANSDYDDMDDDYNGDSNNNGSEAQLHDISNDFHFEELTIDDFYGVDFVKGGTKELKGAPAGWSPPGPPEGWKYIPPKGSPAKEAIENPGGWNLYSFAPKMSSTGKKEYERHFTPAGAGAKVLPANRSGVCEVDGWRLYYDGWYPDSFDKLM
jgi:hypothetical protein